MRRVRQLSIMCVTGIFLLGTSVGTGATAAPAAPAASAATAAPAPYTVHIISHNVQRKSDAITRAIDQAKNDNAEVVLLQEVCQDQATALMNGEGKGVWSFNFRPGNTERACGGDTNGDLVIWRGGANATSSGTDGGKLFDNQYDGTSTSGAPLHTLAGITCLKYQSRYHICSTHLESQGDKSIRADEAQEIKSLTAPWIANGDSVIVGGDFNTVPGITADGNGQPLNVMYGPGSGSSSNGNFLECYRTSSGSRDRDDVYAETKKASGGWTNNLTLASGNQLYRKIDYVFISTSVTTPSMASSEDEIATSSDHRMISATARVNFPS